MLLEPGADTLPAPPSVSCQSTKGGDLLEDCRALGGKEEERFEVEEEEEEERFCSFLRMRSLALMCCWLVPCSEGVVM